MDRERRLLGLTGVLARGNEQKFDGSYLEPGAHLRWSFRPELGFPRNGYKIFRKVSTQSCLLTEKLKHSWMSRPSHQRHLLVCLGGFWRI